MDQLDFLKVVAAKLEQQDRTGHVGITGTMRGEVLVFLTVNKFRVQLDDGQIVDAVMPDTLLEVVRPWYEDRSKGPDHIRVTVCFREAPAMHVISTVGSSGWCGVRRANRR